MKLKQILSGVLALCLLCTSCAVSSASESGGVRIEREHAAVDFTALTYERPDLDGINGKIDSALSYARGEQGRPEEALPLYREIITLFVDYDTMSTLASIRHDLDLSETYYDEESVLLDNAWTKLDNRMNELTAAILDSPAAKAFREEWGEDFISRYEINSRLNSPEIEALSEQETDLVNTYSKLAVQEYTTTLNGEEVGLADLDLSTEEGVMAFYEIYQKKNAELGEIYRQLITVRTEMAKVLGYDSYTDYAYDCLGRDYTKEESAAFCAKVKRELAPLYQELDEAYYSLIMEAESRSTRTLADGIPTLEKALPEGYPEKMQEALAYMVENKLYDFDASPNKIHAGYSTILGGLRAPFMLVNPADYRDPGTVFHEFGHYYNFYLMDAPMWGDGNNLDMAEIHSQALELLMFDSYEELYGEDAWLIACGTVLDIVYSVLAGCAEDEFQQKAFENPDMTLDELNRLHGSIYESYMGYPMYFEWVDIHHHYEQPFYYVSYATSAVSALEIWEIAETDRGKALEIYDKITGYTLNAGYREALKASGLSDPFRSDCVGKIADVLESAFSDEEQAAA